MAETATPLVRMSGIVKRFGMSRANDGVDFELLPGEVHALLGENGAGKSTLMNILSGLYAADAGAIELGGRPARIATPRQALDAGIGMVHQHFMLVKGMTVAENVILGLEGTRFVPDLPAIHARIEELSRRYGLPVDPAARVWQLSIGERQRVEILKLLFRDVRVLILDEPTAVLTPGETEHFFSTIRRLRQAGAGVVFISHKLEEVMAVSDRVTVLRGGRNAATVATADTTPGELAGLMFGGREPSAGAVPALAAAGEGEVLSLERVWAKSDRGLDALRDVSLAVRRGEIFGLLGVAGNGQKELVEVATGLRRPSGGHVRVGGEDLTGRPPGRFIRAGVAHVPEDRLGMGIVAGMNLAENLALKAGGAWRQGARRGAAELLVSWGVSPADPRFPAGALSGGNVQRLILARELSGSPRLLVAAYPLQGLDIGATDFIARTLRERAAAGLAVLLVGEDLELTLAVSHRVAVIYEGRIRGVSPADSARVEDLGLLMAGHGAGFWEGTA